MRVGRFVMAALALTVWSVAADGAGPKAGLATRRREPVALASAEGGRWLFVANHASGTVSVVDPEARAVVAEIEVGRSLADLVLTPDGRRALVVDQGADQLDDRALPEHDVDDLIAFLRSL